MIKDIEEESKTKFSMKAEFSFSFKGYGDSGEKLLQLNPGYVNIKNGHCICSDHYNGPVVKRLRHRPFTAVTRVRFPSGSVARKRLKYSR